MSLILRSRASPRSLVPEIRRQVAAVAPDQPLYNVKTMEEVLADATQPQRLSAALVSIFGCVAFGLAAIGLYAVMSLLVSRRAREIGIRVALGAGVREVIGLVVGAGAWQVGLGAILGIALAAALGRLIAGFLYHVESWDPAVFVSVPVGLSLAGLLACAVPAWRAARTEAAVALREE